MFSQGLKVLTQILYSILVRAKPLSSCTLLGYSSCQGCHGLAVNSVGCAEKQGFCDLSDICPMGPLPIREQAGRWSVSTFHLKEGLLQRGMSHKQDQIRIQGAGKSAPPSPAVHKRFRSHQNLDRAGSGSFPRASVRSGPACTLVLF